MNTEVCFIVHGPISDNAYKEVFGSLLKIKNRIHSVIVSTYTDCRKDTEKSIQKYGGDLKIKPVYSKDILNPGYFNLNRQILTVRAGLDNVPDKTLVVKLRNDQWCDTNKLIKILDKTYFSNENEHRITTTNCFTRVDRLYHPSDMFLCGWKEDMVDYFSYPYQENTHMGIQLEMMTRLRKSSDEFVTYLVSPESELFKHYLSLKDWSFKYTFEDSYEALKKYICLINTWDIDLRWNKQRNAFLPAKTIILPYSFSMVPCEGAPVEQAKCYARHDFEGHKTFRDKRFLFWARFVFSVKYNRIHYTLVKMKNKTPRFIKAVFRHTPIGRFFKNVTQ